MHTKDARAVGEAEKCPDGLEEETTCLLLRQSRARPSRVSQAASGPDSRRWLALALLGTAFFMVILDGTIVYVALPSIDQALGFSAGGLQWVMSAYLLTVGGLLLLGGRSADLLGRRRMFMVGVALFAGSSLLCGLAWSAQVLVAARVLQGWPRRSWRRPRSRS